MEMWKGGAAADEIKIRLRTVIVGVVKELFPKPRHSIHKGPLHIYIYIYIYYNSKFGPAKRKNEKCKKKTQPPELQMQNNYL